MTRFTLLSFLLLSGFFYISGKPAGDDGGQVPSFAPSNLSFVSGIQSNVNAAAGKKSSANHSVVAKQVSINTQPTVATRSAREDIVASLDLPTLPTRNPKRAGMQSKKSIIVAKLAKMTVATTKNNATRIIGEARNKLTVAELSPLNIGQKNKYTAASKPVLGPRVTTVLLKRELRRVGCYDGNVDSKWGESIRGAINRFNNNTGYSISTKSSSSSALEQVQQFKKTVCGEEAPVGRTIIATAVAGGAIKAAQKKKTNKWQAGGLSGPQKAAYSKSSGPKRTRKSAATNYNLNTKEAYRRQRLIAAKEGVTRRTASKWKKIRLVAKKRKTAVRGWKRKLKRKKRARKNVRRGKRVYRKRYRKFRPFNRLLMR